MKEKKPLLSVDHLEISFRDERKSKIIVRDVSFQLRQGEIVALTGPSGCGKSLTASAIVGLLGNEFQITKGEIMYDDDNITVYSEKQLQHLRRDEIGLLIQDSLNALNPIQTVKRQMTETLKQKKKWKKTELENKLHRLLQQVGLPNPEHILSSYPYELSGGMRQRVLLAMMLSLQPKILIADEPTTALDVMNKDKVLDLLKQLVQQLNVTILLISHDDKSISKYADRVIQMEKGGKALAATKIM